MARIYTATAFAARLRDFPMASRPLIKSLMAEAAATGEALSQRLVPVKTGALRDSIGFRSTTERGWTFLMQARANADYATFVEEGTSRMPPRPFVMPGVELAADQIEILLGMMVDEYL